jgi:hypothetical protein
MLARVVNGQSVASGAVANADVDTRRIGTLTVVTKLAGTGTVGDLTQTDCLVYDPAGAVTAIPLPPRLTGAVAVAGSDVAGVKVYDVSGVEKVRLTAKNNNVAALNLTVDVYGQAEGRG